MTMRKYLGLALLLTACAGEIDGPFADDVTDEFGDARRQTLNRQTLNALEFNAIIADPSANAALTANPLRGDTFRDHPVLAPALRSDPYAQEFMGYLVRCALEPWQPVDFDASGDGAPDKIWYGQFGLCPSWFDGAASPACQEVVSACLLAHVNAFGVSVPLSLRGEGPGGAIPLDDPATTVPVARDGKVIKSFKPCYGSSLFADCGWKPEPVIVCTPGQTVRVGMGGRSGCGGVVGSASGDVVLRVCRDGVRGCDGAASWQNDDSGGGGCYTTGSYIEFTCGPEGRHGVMSAPYQRGGTATGSVDVVRDGGADVRVSETRVYTWPEAGWYGNVFRPDMLGVNVFQSGGTWWVHELATGHVHARDPNIAIYTPVFRDMWVCSSPVWVRDKAYVS
jgi:hypothetical protein